MSDKSARLCSHREADEGKHRESAVLDLLQLQLRKVALHRAERGARHALQKGLSYLNSRRQAAAVEQEGMAMSPHARLQMPCLPARRTLEKLKGSKMPPG